MLFGNCFYNDTNFLFVDIPGTYSIMSNSEEEEIARDYICFGNPDATVIVVDSTCLERNLNLVFQVMEITNNVILCVNLLDEAKKKKIKIDLDKLSKLLGIPVVGTIARKKKTLDNLLDVIYKVCKKEICPIPKKITYSDLIESCILELESILNENLKIPKQLSRWVSLKIIDGDKNIINSIEKNLKVDILNNLTIKDKVYKIRKTLNDNNINQNSFKDTIVSSIVYSCENICKSVCSYENTNYSLRDRKIDKILTSKNFGIPIMILFLGLIFWLTIIGANYPSSALFAFFGWIQEKLLLGASLLNFPSWLSDMLILGVYQTLTWVIAVMLPPMAIFFPLFTFLEDLGYLPRIAFNMDGFFKKCCCSR